MAKKKRKPKSRHEMDRKSITHPALLDAFDADWYYPWPVEDWPKEDREHPLVKKAIKEGWAEWIECQADLEAVKQGYGYDLSRDKKGKPVYWYAGSWQRWEGRGRNRTLIKIPTEEANEVVAYVGRGDHICRFTEAFLYHTKAPLEEQPYRLIHWQRKVFLTAYGWVRHETDAQRRKVRYRRYRQVYIAVPKKNGKSELGSIVAIYSVRADFTLKARVYGTANEKKQARIVFDEARDFVKASPHLSDEIYILDSKTDAKLSHLESGSTYEVISADADSSDGPDASGIIFDEIHRQKNRQLYATLRRSGQSRPQPMEFVTTTYGETYKSIWGEVHLKNKAVLQNRKAPITKFQMIASAEAFKVHVAEDAPQGSTLLKVQRLEQSIDVGEEIELKTSQQGGTNSIVKLAKPAKRFQRFLEVEPTESIVKKYSGGEANKFPLDPKRLDHAIRRSNPSLGITTSFDTVKSLILEATTPLEQAEAKRFNLNILAGGGSLWLSAAAWFACGQRRVLPSQVLKKRCFGGLDLSQTNDLTAFWLAFPSWSRKVKYSKAKNPKIRLMGWVWVPGEDLEARQKAEEVPYIEYAEKPYFAGKGCVRICEGSTIDYQQVGKEIVEICEYFIVQAIAYDSHLSQFVTTPYLEPAGLSCIAHRQGAVSMGPASQRFESLVESHEIYHGNHPLLDEAVDGCVLRMADDVGNRLPSKKKSLSRIDPLITTIMASSWCCDPPEGLPSGAWQGKGTGIWD